MFSQLFVVTYKKTFIASIEVAVTVAAAVALAAAAVALVMVVVVVIEFIRTFFFSKGKQRKNDIIWITRHTTVIWERPILAYS